MAQAQKTHQRHGDAQEADTDMPQGAKTEIDEAALSATLADVDEVLAEQEAEAEKERQRARSAALLAFRALNCDDRDAVEAFNNTNESLGLSAMVNGDTCGCGCIVLLMENGKAIDYVYG